ncbi:hypothetical protein [Marinilabilia sp.]|uniref:hypothetical protein n=1 Tax=Marinilabilia sp. TaxID=2021252 RepID=UPI0025B7AE48|nr:hypothetical protein [Marinilabilia sp.]
MDDSIIQRDGSKYMDPVFFHVDFKNVQNHEKKAARFADPAVFYLLAFILPASNLRAMSNELKTTITPASNLRAMSYEPRAKDHHHSSLQPKSNEL